MWTLEEALDALRLACEDAWPKQEQWPEFYLKLARAKRNANTEVPGWRLRV